MVLSDGGMASPGKIKTKLINAGLFLVAYELLKTFVLKRTRGFFTDMRDAKLALSDEYEHEVRSLHKSEVQACLLWLARKFKALSADDIAAFDRIRRHRNALAHELPSYLVEEELQVDMSLLDGAEAILAKVAHFWIDVWTDLDPAWDGEAVNYEASDALASIWFRHIREIATQARLDGAISLN